MAKKEIYEQKALDYANKYGIITYKVVGNKMIYNVNFYNSEFKGKWVRHPCTVQRTVNLDTFEVTSKQLQRVQKNGWNNISY